ncbi:hypothetical protein ACWEQL_22695 [Kitasatospora sp. NPDC004240]
MLEPLAVAVRENGEDGVPAGRAVRVQVDVDTALALVRIDQDQSEGRDEVEEPHLDPGLRARRLGELAQQVDGGQQPVAVHPGAVGGGAAARRLLGRRTGRVDQRHPDHRTGDRPALELVHQVAQRTRQRHPDDPDVLRGPHMLQEVRLAPAEEFRGGDLSPAAGPHLRGQFRHLPAAGEHATGQQRERRQRGRGQHLPSDRTEGTEDRQHQRQQRRRVDLQIRPCQQIRTHTPKKTHKGHR